MKIHTAACLALQGYCNRDGFIPPNRQGELKDMIQRLLDDNAELRKENDKLLKGKTKMNEWRCKRCGQCCRNNGFLPPYNLGDVDENKPQWFDDFRDMVTAIVPPGVIRNTPCMFLDGIECLVHYSGLPAYCRDFNEEDCLHTK